MGIGPTRGPAMTDVAALAGVSHQTVSRVVNGHPNVRQQTRLRVLAAMQELGYRPNPAARALATGRTNVIGIVARSTTLFGPSSMLTAVEAAAVDAGYQVSVSSVPALDQATVLQAVSRHVEARAQGIIVISPNIDAADAVDAVPDDMPLVTISADRTRLTRCASVDQFEGAAQATQALLDAGHRTVWHISGPIDQFDSVERIAGWRSVLERAGAEVPPVVRGDWSAALGYEAGTMLARIPEVTAVFAANDQTAMGLLRALHEAGRPVPAEISVVGFDDRPESEYLIPPLTTVRQDFAAVAAAAIRMLHAQIQSDADLPSVTVPTTLVVRGSVAAPPGPSPVPAAGEGARRGTRRGGQA